MKPYTVLLLRPDWQRNNLHPADWVCRTRVTATDPQAAIPEAVAELNRIDNRGDWEDLTLEDDLAVLAIYEGHLEDLFGPEAA